MGYAFLIVVGMASVAIYIQQTGLDDVFLWALLIPATYAVGMAILNE